MGRHLAQWIVVLALSAAIPGSTEALGPSVPHPWDGNGRTQYVRDAAERSFDFEHGPRLATLPELFLGPAPESFFLNPEALSAAEAELHVIGVSQGQEPDLAPDGRPTAKPIEVFVRATAKPLVLFLSAFTDSAWEIKLEDGARLQAVYRAENDGSAVRVASSVPPLRTIPLDERRPLYRYTPSELGEPGAVEILARISSRVGLPLESFQGRHRGTVFVVPPYHDPSVVREILSEHQRVLLERSVAAPAPFDVIVENTLVARGEPGCRILSFDRSVSVATYCEVGGKFYGIASDELFAIDPATGVSAEIARPSDHPPFSWLGGIAYDAERKRLVITTLFPAGYHRTYDPVARDWRLFPTHKSGGGLYAVAYDSETRLIYGLRPVRLGGGDTGPFELAAFDSEFNLTNVLQPVPPLILHQVPSGGPQLAIGGSGFIVCTSGGLLARGRKPLRCCDINRVSHELRMLQIPTLDPEEFVSETTVTAAEEEGEKTTSTTPFSIPCEGDFVRYVAKRAFVFADVPPLASVPELFLEPAPESFYLNPKHVDPPSEHELHVVGVYEGEEPGTTSDGRLIRKPIEVVVQATVAPSVLFLAAATRVDWEIRLNEGARLEAVYHAGERESTVRGDANLPLPRQVPDGSQMVLVSYESRERGERDGQAVLSAISSFVGFPVESFQGRYRGTKFVVPPYREGSLVRSILTEHQRLLRDKTVEAPGPYNLIVGMSLVRKGEDGGPREGRVILRLRECFRAVTHCDVDGKFYAVTSDAAFVIQSTGEVTEIAPTLEYPRLGPIGGITYDAERKRLVIVTRSDGGFHHTYDPVAQDWRVFPVEKTGRGFGAITYDPAERLIYGVTESGLTVLTSDLDPVRSIVFDVSPSLPQEPDASIQLAKAGSALVLCSFVNIYSQCPASEQPRCFVVDPRQGTVQLLDLGASPG